MWYDLFRLWQYANAKDPESQISDRQFPGAGTSQPDAVPDIRSDGSFWGGSKGQIRLRETNDFIDLSTVTNRQNRYREYERLRNVAEIEFAMNVFADEACVAGSTKIATPFWGNVSIEWLAENKKDEKFAVYCWDFEKQDFTIGWAYDPRLVKEAETIEFFLDNGTKLIVTEDHKLLMSDNTWREAGKVEIGEEFKAFYKIEANQEFTKLGTNQYPRIYTYENGWVHERQFIDEWRAGKPDERYEKANKARKWLAGGMSLREIQRQTGHNREIVKSWIEKEGFSLREIKWLGNKPLTRRVIAKRNHAAIKVYDLSVEVHKNFCTEYMVCHNCQKGENGHPFEIQVKDKEVKEELEFLFRHKKMLNLDQKKLWNYFKNLFVFGDSFFEIIINPDKPSDGVMNIMPLPADSMYRIETTKGKLLEFQQSKEGPDYQSLSKVEVTKATMADLQQATAIRFAAEQIIHIRVGDDRKTFYPYGISLIEAARGPAHQLRLMEDAMVVYRLVRAPERRVFYIDVQQLPPFKAEAFIKRMKDQFRKKKVATGRVGDQGGAGKIEERWHSQPMDEDFWIPVRPNSNTRIETLPGANNLGEIDDAIYFRNKLFVALQFPKNYINQEDPGQTRISLSQQDSKFSRYIERLQSYMEDGLWEIAERHMKLRGFPEERYEDLIIRMTPPSEYRELSQAEVITNRINNAGSLKGAQLMSDYDILTKWLKYDDVEAKEIIARLKIQKLEDLKLQVMAQNPILLGVGTPSNSNEPEMGTEPGGPNPNIGPDGQPMPQQQQQPPMPEGGEQPQPDMQGLPQGEQKSNQAEPLPEISDDEAKKYDLEIQDYAQEQDVENIDYSSEDEG